MRLLCWQSNDNMIETIVTSVVMIWILSYSIVNDGVPDFLFHKPDQTACLSMRYTTPWETIVDVDKYVRKSEYQKGIEEKHTIKSSNIDITRRNIDHHFRFVKTNVLLFVKSKRDTKIHLGVLSHYVCVNSIPKENTPHHVVLAFHVCDKENKKSRSPSVFIRNMIGKIANEIPEFGNVLMNDRSIKYYTTAEICEIDPFICINAGLIKPLSRLIEKPAFKNIILISGIDECKHLYHEHNENPISLDVFLNKTVSQFPEWIKFLFISKRRQRIENLFPLFHQEFYDDDEGFPLLTEVKNAYGGPDYSILYLIGIFLAVISVFCLYLENARNSEEAGRAGRTLFNISLWLWSIRPSLFTESFRGNISKIRYHLNVRSTNINAKHHLIGLSPLHLAALNGQHHACEFLLDREADPNTKADPSCYPYLLGYIKNDSSFYFGDCKDSTALRLAILFDQELCVKVLLKKGREMRNQELSLCIELSKRNENIELLFLQYVADYIIEKYLNLKLVVRYCYEPGPSNTRIIMCYSDKLYSVTNEKYLGVEIRIQNPNIIHDEESVMLETDTKDKYAIDHETLCLMEKAIQLNGDRLFQRHSNLNIITVSAASLSKEGKVSKGPCIVLYCTTKDVIPLNEELFPNYIYINGQTIRTDIREGYFSLCPGGVTPRDWNKPLRSGASIGIKGDKSQEATMGPFVQLRGGELGFITCAHLFTNVSNDLKTDVVQPAGTVFTSSDITEDEKVCGKLVQSKFEPDRHVSVDAAVVKITSRIPDRGHFALNTRLELREAGFDDADFPVFDSGSVRTEINAEDATKTVIKFGSNTGLTRGAFRLNGAQVRIKRDVDLTLPLNSQTFVMKGQYEIQSVGPKDFFQPGDSGSGVFIVDENKQLHCIGIAIGCTKYRSAIVTPIKDVLEALGLPRKLKTFVPEEMQH